MSRQLLYTNYEFAFLKCDKTRKNKPLKWVLWKCILHDQQFENLPYNSYKIGVNFGVRPTTRRNCA